MKIGFILSSVYKHLKLYIYIYMQGTERASEIRCITDNGKKRSDYE